MRGFFYLIVVLTLWNVVLVSICLSSPIARDLKPDTESKTTKDKEEAKNKLSEIHGQREAQLKNERAKMRTRVPPPTTGASEPQSSSKNSPSCFPETAQVVVVDESRRKRMMPIRELRIGDSVQVGHRTSSPVYMFSHAERDEYYKFIVLVTHVGNLTASADHYVHTTAGIHAMRHISIGDQLLTADQSKVAVIRIEQTWAKGLYNPQTIDGNMLVDGFLVSTFTGAIREQVGVALLAPIRSMFRLSGIDISNGLFHGDNVVRRLLW